MFLDGVGRCFAPLLFEPLNIAVDGAEAVWFIRCRVQHLPRQRLLYLALGATAQAQRGDKFKPLGFYGVVRGVQWHDVQAVAI